MHYFSKILDVKGREVLDSRGNPTVEAVIYTTNGCEALASVPSGASTGVYEAIEKRDQDLSRYNGKGVNQAVKTINVDIKNCLENQPVGPQLHIDRLMRALDGTDNKSHLGANAMLAVSIAHAKAGACESGLPLYQYLGGVYAHMMPVPMFNIINGGVHAKNNLDFQEFMIMPIGACCFREALRMGTEVYHELKHVLSENGYSTAIGDEGGFAPDISDAKEVFLLISEAVKRAGYEPGKDIVYAIDAAASELYSPDGGCYYFDGETRAKCENVNKAMQPDTICTKITRTTNELIDYYEMLAEEFPLYSIEDGLDQNDWEGWKILTERLGRKIQLVGDDLFVTNSERLKEGIKKGCANAVLIKPNQIGTVSETLETIRVAKAHGYRTIISHRSGETEDTFIADLAVAVNAGQIKTGAPCRSERVAKYNRLLRIEEALGNDANYWIAMPNDY